MFIKFYLKFYTLVKERHFLQICLLGVVFNLFIIV